MTLDLEHLLKNAQLSMESQPFGVSFDVLPEDFPVGASKEKLKTSISILLAWSLDRGFIDNEAAESTQELQKALGLASNRKASPLELLNIIHDKFLPCYLQADVRGFLVGYYWPGWIYRYDVDFDNVFVAEYKSPILVPPGYLTRWDVPATWVEAEKMFPIIDQRFSEWKNAK